MRHGRALILMLFCGMLLGCVSGQPARSTTSWLTKLRPFQGNTEPDLVLLEVVLLERPIGDNYVNEEVWNFADEQIVSLEHRAMLEDNGLRVGQLGGITPAGLQTLLSSEKSCANPRRVQLRAGTTRTLLIGPLIAQTQYTIHDQGETSEISFEQAEHTLVVIPTLTSDGKTRLQFTPQVRHGEKRLQFRPAGDQASWALRENQPTEVYSRLGWDVTLAPNEFAIVGARYDRVQTLGHQFFVRPDEGVPVQRLLVIRTSRSIMEPMREEAETAEKDPASPVPPPLAVQAALTPASPPPKK